MKKFIECPTCLLKVHEDNFNFEEQICDHCDSAHCPECGSDNVYYDCGDYVCNSCDNIWKYDWL